MVKGKRQKVKGTVSTACVSGRMIDVKGERQKAKGPVSTACVSGRMIDVKGERQKAKGKREDDLGLAFQTQTIVDFG